MSQNESNSNFPRGDETAENQYFDPTDESKFLIFQLDTELYGTPLLGVRQVLQPHRPKPIPNTTKHFLGLVSIRGQVMGVVDLRIRFNYPIADGPNVAFLVFETESGPLAVIVDKVEAVVQLSEELLQSQSQSKLNIRSQIPLEYLIGAVTHRDQLVTLIDLNKTLSNEDYVEIHNAKLATAG
jgi:purine-binding chemotaxis protein CheW